jgi:hypothetical protein
METWEKAIQLEQFIRDYTPSGYKEPIHVFDFIPSVTEVDYIVIYGAWKNGLLEGAMKNYSNEFAGIKSYRFNKPYIISAINAYFNTLEV